MGTKWYKISMQVPSKDFAYAPTGKSTNEDMSTGPCAVVQVSFDTDKVSNPRPVTAHTKGMRGWFIKGDKK